MLTRMYLGLIVLSLNLVSGCVSIDYSDDVYAKVGIDDAFSPYVLVFEQAWGAQVTGVNIQFAPSIEKNVAVCYDNKEPRLILVDRGDWEASSEEGRETTILHELGHCVLNRSVHTDSVNDFGVPLSIMYSESDEALDKCYKEHKDAYLIELFHYVVADELWSCEQP